jgi:hypothetical protein
VTDRPGPPDQPPDSQDSRAEQVLSQALRAMVGGDKPNSDRSSGEKPTGTTVSAGGSGTGGSGTGGSGTGGGRRRLTTGQLLLLAAIVGLLVGIAAGLLSLLL